MPKYQVSFKPKGRKTAYTYFTERFRVEIKKYHPEIPIGLPLFAKSCSMGWKSLTDEQKAPFRYQAELDKQRFNDEMRTYDPANALKKELDCKKKHNKDPNAPKRPLSAFFWFCYDQRTKVRGMYYWYSHHDVTKKLRRMWATADRQTKERYNMYAEKDRQRFLREMETYKNNNYTEPMSPWLRFSLSSSHPLRRPIYNVEETEEESESEDDIIVII